ncbi:MAG: hypothetical protein ACLUI3_10070 [Christensenellales bacterium]
MNTMSRIAAADAGGAMRPDGQARQLREAHFPTNFDRLAQAKERLAYEELLLFQAGVAGAAGERRRAQPLEIQNAWIEEFFDKLPFAPTRAQRRRG